MAEREADGSESVGVALLAPRSLGELAEALGGTVDQGASERTVLRIVSPELAARDDELVVVTHVRSLDRAGRALGAFLCQADLAHRLPHGARWIHPRATWAMARLLEPIERARAPLDDDGHATIEPGADVDPTAVIGRDAIVLRGARVGAYARIAPRAIIYGGVRLGERVVVGPGAVVGHRGFGWVTSPTGELVRVPQLGGVVVEDDVEIGALATVDSGTLSPTILRRGVKLDAQVHVAHNVEIGPGTLVAAQSGFAGSARVGEGVLVGGQAGVADHAEIGRGARIAAKSGVIGDVPPRAVVAGFPAIPRFRWLRVWASLVQEEKRRHR